MNDTISTLTDFGFSVYEAKAYLALLQKSPAIGYAVSKTAKIPTAKIYETLANLKNKGAVLASSSEPVLYYPVDPDVLLHRIRHEIEEKMKNLDEALHTVQPMPDIDITWNLSDYRVVVEKMKSVILNAEKTLLVSLWPQEAMAVQEQLSGAERNGVQVIAAIFGDYNPGCAHSMNLESCGYSSQKRLGKRLNVVVGDSREAVICEMSDSENALGIWATTPCIVLVAKEYIRHDIWGKALVDEVGEERFHEMCRNDETLSYLIQNR